MEPLTLTPDQIKHTKAILDRAVHNAPRKWTLGDVAVLQSKRAIRNALRNERQRLARLRTIEATLHAWAIAMLVFAGGFLAGVALVKLLR